MVAVVEISRYSLVVVASAAVLQINTLGYLGQRFSQTRIDGLKAPQIVSRCGVELEMK